MREEADWFGGHEHKETDRSISLTLILMRLGEFA